MRALASILLLCAVGCGSDADVAGNYTVALTNRDNGCNFTNYTVGNTATNIPVVITQSGSQVTLTVEGIPGGYLNLLLGTNVYTGSVDGDDFTVKAAGAPRSMGNCALSYNSTITGTLEGDALTGRIEYTAATNGNPDCAGLEGCLTYQDYNGTRPPQ